MGVHTGDSWTVAPQQTLPDAEYQRLREAAFDCARAIGVATGGANVQFAYEPETRELRVIEMNPRVSRSSALASKATGFPIAKIAALLAIGYTLDELPNDITQQTTAAFEPALDYVAVKAPRFDFEKFPDADDRLGSEMRAVGESLGLGRTFPEAFLKALDGREIAYRPQLDLSAAASRSRSAGISCSRRRDKASTSPASIRTSRKSFVTSPRRSDSQHVPSAKRFGLPDAAIARVLGISRASTYAREAAAGPARRRFVRRGVRGADAVLLSLVRALGRQLAPTGQAVVVLGSGPNRIGQGIEFDYCCVHAASTFRALGYEAVLVNPNPGDGVDRLRHLRPPVPGTADARAHARRVRARAATRRRRVVRRTDAAEARAGTRRRRRAVCWAIRSLRSTRQRTGCASPGYSTSSA